MRNINVMIFDSGIGGLSIAKHVRELPVDIALTYVADNAAFPYGTKSIHEVVARTTKVIGAALRRYAPELVVIGCNTASTLALAALRDAFDVPFVGVVPAIKPACLVSKSKHIGVLATSNTVATAYLQNLIQEFAGSCQVTLHGSAQLAWLAEQKLQGTQPSLTSMRAELASLIEASRLAQLDTIVLACTHFPLLKDELAQIFPSAMTWVDSAEAIARRVHSLTGTLPIAPKTQRDTIFSCTSQAMVYQNQEIENLLGSYRAEWLNVR